MSRPYRGDIRVSFEIKSRQKPFRREKYIDGESVIARDAFLRNPIVRGTYL